jgi:hypothetical protein
MASRFSLLVGWLVAIHPSIVITGIPAEHVCFPRQAVEIISGEG